MKRNNKAKDRNTLSVALLAVSVLLASSLVVKGARYMIFASQTPELIAEATINSKPDPNETKKFSEQTKELTGKLTKKNMFAPPPPKPENPIKKVDIIGNSVLINGNLYGVGDDVTGAKILRIEPTQITYEWQGEKTTIGPFGTISSGSGEKPSEEETEPRRPRSRPRPDRTAESPRDEDRPRRWEGRGRGERGGRGGYFSNLSEEERERIRNMSRDERREYFRQRREEASGEGNQ
jgi:hypothetical protein